MRRMDPNEPKQIQKHFELFIHVRGLIFVCNSVPYAVVMKNSLDWLYSKHTSGKVFGLVSTLGGQPSNNTLNHMRIAARWVGRRRRGTAGNASTSCRIGNETPPPRT